VTQEKKDIQSLAKKNWYNDRYEFVVIQRNIFAIITLISLVLSIVVTFSISQLTPLKSVEPFVIQIDQKTGVTQVVNPIKSKELLAQDAVNNFFIVEYIRARESHLSQDVNYYNYNLVRVLSDPAIFRAYTFEIALSNPESPAARMVNGGTRDVHISSIKYVSEDKDSAGNQTLRYDIRVQITERGTQAGTRVLQKLISLKFKYVALELTTEDRYLNPLGFRVIDYKAYDENVPQ